MQTVPACMPFFKKLNSSLLFLLLAGFCQAQTTKVDSLFVLLKQASANESRLSIVLTLCEEYQSLNRDTLYSLALEAGHLAAMQPDKEKKALAGLALSDAYMQWGWSDSALAVLEPFLTDERDYSPGTYFKMRRHHGMIYTGHAEFEKALSILYPALTGAEKWKDTLNAAAIMNSLGSINIAMQKPEEALVWIRKAAALCASNTQYNTVLASVYTNAANVFMLKSKEDSAEYYIKLAIPLCRATENLFVLATALRINASLLTNKKRFAQAEEALKEMMTIRKTTIGEGLFVEDNLNLANFYARSGQLEKAISLCNTVLGRFSNRNKSDTATLQTTIATDPKIRLEYWQALAVYYKQAGRLSEYEEALEQVIVLKDSVYEANYAPAIADAETKYQVQKKENTILQQKYSLQRSRILLYGLLALLTMSFVIAYFILRDLRRRQKSKMAIALAAERMKAETAVKEAEEKERIRIAADLHDNIGAYATAIRADVEKVEQELLQNKSSSLANLQQHSQEIIDSLRDTIWVLNKEHITITGISDRIKNYVNKLRPSYSQVQFNITETIKNDVRVNSRAALNIFRIVQEAVHNSLKHSGAKNIDIAIHSIDTAVITIGDDGKGMPAEQQYVSGNGLANMQTRATESGLQVKVTSQENRGTTISIFIPTTN